MTFLKALHFVCDGYVSSEEVEPVATALAQLCKLETLTWCTKEDPGIGMHVPGDDRERYLALNAVTRARKALSSQHWLVFVAVMDILLLLDRTVYTCWVCIVGDER